jgi:hypothetical protein
MLGPIAGQSDILFRSLRNCDKADALPLVASEGGPRVLD